MDKQGGAVREFGFDRTVPVVARVKAGGKTMEFAASAGARLACRADGDPSHPVVILSNSLASDHRMWDWQMPVLVPGFRVIRYDTRGHGASDVPEGPYSIELLARDCLAVLDHFGGGKAHFVGLSLGGMTGQWLGAEAGERFLSLTLCDTAFTMPRDVWDQRIRQVREDGFASLVDATVERWFTPPFKERAPAEIERVREMVAGTPDAGYLGCASAIRDMSLEPLLARIALPTRIIVGEQDGSTPPAAAEKLHRAIAGSDLKVVPEAAHLSNIEQPEIFNQALQEFLYRQTGASVA